MNSISIFFLRAKHWQLFAVLVAGAVLFLVFGNRYNLWVLAALSQLCYLTWLWAAGVFLTAAAKPALRLKIGLFWFDFFCFMLYSLTAVSLLDKKLSLPNSLLSALAIAFIPLHFLTMFCVFHIFYFVSKSLLLVETDGPVSFRNYAATFFLIWFLPLGIWTIQPRINRLYRAAQDSAVECPMLKSRA
jgi:hypothetical protein